MSALLCLAMLGKPSRMDGGSLPFRFLITEIEKGLCVFTEPLAEVADLDTKIGCYILC